MAGCSGFIYGRLVFAHSIHSSDVQPGPPLRPCLGRLDWRHWLSWLRNHCLWIVPAIWRKCRRKITWQKRSGKRKTALHEVWGLDGCFIPLASLAARGGIVHGRFPENAMAYICDGTRVWSPADGVYVCDGRAHGVGSPCHFDDTECNRTTLALVVDWQENDDISRETKTLTQPVDNACFVEVIGGHLNFDSVSNRQADEPLTHLT